MEEESFFSIEEILSSKKCRIKDRDYETIAGGFKDEGLYIFKGKYIEAHAKKIGTETNLL